MAHDSPKMVRSNSFLDLRGGLVSGLSPETKALCPPAFALLVLLFRPEADGFQHPEEP
jgi:hypothetical protein